MWKFHEDESNQAKYGIILGIDILTALRIDIKISKHAIVGGVGPYEGCK